MNLHNLAGLIILTWLPLASLNLHERNFSSTTFPHEKTYISDENETNFPDNVTKGLEKKSVKEKDGKQKVWVPKVVTSGNFLKKISANYNLRYEIKIGGKKEKAHKLTGSVKKDLSAFKIYNRLKKKSAVIFKRNINSKRKKLFAKREAVSKISGEEDLSLLEEYEDEDIEEGEEKNTTEAGGYVGAKCEQKCSPKLLHVFCDPKSKVCECEEKYPVQIGEGVGCEKPKQLGDQCFYAETCSFFDPNAVCMQINHNAICQCKPGYHSVSLRKGVKRMFCSEDITGVSTNLPTLLGVATGIAILTGLICFVLKLFSGNRYPNARHYANANVAPPLLLSSDNQWINGIPLTVHGRPSSRSSYQRSTTSLTQFNRSKGVMVPASRAGSRRHSFSSVQSTSSSQKSMTYSARRFEQENQQREQRAAMKSAREEAAKLATPLTPSPMSVEGLILPSRTTEEDPLCNHKEELPAQSEPPAFLLAQGTNTENTSSK